MDGLRRGDYVFLEFVPLLPLTTYKESFDTFNSKILLLRFFVLSFKIELLLKLNVLYVVFFGLPLDTRRSIHIWSSVLERKEHKKVEYKWKSWLYAYGTVISMFVVSLFPLHKWGFFPYPSKFSVGVSKGGRRVAVGSTSEVGAQCFRSGRATLRHCDQTRQVEEVSRVPVISFPAGLWNVSGDALVVWGSVGGRGPLGSCRLGTWRGAEVRRDWGKEDGCTFNV